LADDDYDATLVPPDVPVAVRIHNTVFGLQIDVVDAATPCLDVPRAAEPPPHQPGEPGPGGEPDTLQR
jgi:hypothetical protein